MANTAAIILGHSHVGSVCDALSARNHLPAKADAAHFFVHDVWKHSTQYASPDVGGGVVFNQQVLDAINRLVPRGYKRQHISILGGNGHIVLSLSRHPRPFDFVLPENPDLPLDTSAEIVPSAYIAKILLPFMLPYVWQLISLRQAIGSRIFHIEPPPPYGDDEYVRAHLGSYIPDPNNIISRHLRLKMWRLHSTIMADLCAKNDIEFLAAPCSSLDDEGFLLRDAYGPDATHANAWYGELLLKQLEASIGASCSGFTRFTEGD